MLAIATGTFVGDSDRIIIDYLNRRAEAYVLVARMADATVLRRAVVK